jgi:SAM-dependent methyltransferase
LRILKKRLDELDGKFDVVMFNHVFEHLPDPKITLLTCHRLLSTGGHCFLRIPTVSSYAWKHYGMNWVQLDAPRHLFLHSKESIDVLASETGFRIEKVTYDSTAFQFWGSEQYARDIPLNSPASYSVDRAGSMFTPSAIRGYEKKARELNVQQEGDQAAFVLRKV